MTPGSPGKQPLITFKDDRSRSSIVDINKKANKNTADRKALSFPFISTEAWAGKTNQHTSLHNRTRRFIHIKVGFDP